MAFGLVAGLSVREIRREKPGLVMDLFVYRQRYDDQQHGIRRGNPLAFKE